MAVGWTVGLVSWWVDDVDGLMDCQTGGLTAGLAHKSGQVYDVCTGGQMGR